MNNSRTFTIKNVKFSGYYLYMNSNIWGDFQICISVPLSLLKKQNQPNLIKNEKLKKVLSKIHEASSKESILETSFVLRIQ